MLYTDDRGVGFSVSPILRIAMLYFGDAPRIEYSDIRWFMTYDRLDLNDLATLLNLHWTVFLNRGIVIDVRDARSHALDDGGRAFTSLRHNRPTLVIKALQPAPWSVLIASTTEVDRIAAQIKEHTHSVEQHQPRRFRDFLK